MIDPADLAAVHAAHALLTAVEQPPSVRKIDAVIKAARGGKGLRWATISEALRLLPGNTTGNTAATPGQRFHEEPATAGATAPTRASAPADHKGMVIDSDQVLDRKATPPPLPPPAGTALALLPMPAAAAAPAARLARPIRMDIRSAAEQVADEALKALRDVIEPALVGIRWGEWCKRGNRRATVSMAAAGMSADDIVAAHEEACEDRGGVAVVMSWVQERVMRQAASGGAPRGLRAVPSDGVPTLSEQWASGAITPPTAEEQAQDRAARPQWVKDLAARQQAQA